MNLLDSVLCTSNAQEYGNIFKQHRIDAATLKLLNDQDLQILGIVEEEKRRSLLQHAANLQIPAEKQILVQVDGKYLELMLSQMSIQLTKHLAALSIAVSREDVLICNIKVSKAARCLKGCIESLEKQLYEFETKFIPSTKKNKRMWLGPTIFWSSLILTATLTTSYKIFRLDKL